MGTIAKTTDMTMIIMTMIIMIATTITVSH